MIPLENAQPLSPRSQTWSQILAAERGIRVTSCYRCLRCSNSCPMSSSMDLKPHQVVRLAQLGRKESLLSCRSIWLCLGCEMCSTYCPNGIDIPALMDCLKHMNVEGGREPAEYEIAAFHEAFVNVLGKYGRMNDLRLINRFKMKITLHGSFPSLNGLKQDLGLGWSLLTRGRLSLFAHRSPAGREVKDILQRHGRKEIKG